MDVTESQYKFNLAIDAIYYLTNLLLRNTPNKVEMVGHLISKWDARVTQNLRQIQIREAQKYAEENQVGLDVASVIISAHQAEVHILRKEFADQLKQILINTFLQEMKDEEQKK